MFHYIFSCSGQKLNLVQAETQQSGIGSDRACPINGEHQLIFSASVKNRLI